MRFSHVAKRLLSPFQIYYNQQLYNPQECLKKPPHHHLRHDAKYGLNVF